MKFKIGKETKIGFGVLLGLFIANYTLNAQNTEGLTLCIPGADTTITKTVADTVTVKNEKDFLIHKEEGTYSVETKVKKADLSVKDMDDNDLQRAYTDPLNAQIMGQDSTITHLKTLNNYFKNGAASLKIGLSGEWDNFDPVVGVSYDWRVPIAQENENFSLYVSTAGYGFAPKLESITSTAPELVREVADDMPGSGMYRLAEFWETSTTTTTTQQYADLLLKGKFAVGNYNITAGAGIGISYTVAPVITETKKFNFHVDNATGNVIPTRNPLVLPSETDNSGKDFFDISGVSGELMVGNKDSKLNFGIYTSNQDFNNNDGQGHSGVMFNYKF